MADTALGWLPSRRWCTSFAAILVLLLLLGFDGAAVLSPASAASDPPTVTDVDPDTGPVQGGIRVRLLGEGFTDGTVVRFGEDAATDVTVTSAGELFAVTPAHSEGGVHVTATTANGTSPTGPESAFLYYHGGTWESIEAPPSSGEVGVRLGDGRALIVGSTGVLYDPTPASNQPSWRPTGNDPSASRSYGFTVTVLDDGSVLTVGGCCERDPRGAYLGPFAAADLYDPYDDKWTTTGALNVPRQHHTATLLPDGTVLAVGGCHSVADCDDAPRGVRQQEPSAEIYEPSLGRWVPTTAPAFGRIGHTATLLDDGRVLVVGGAVHQTHLLGAGSEPPPVLAPPEIYDPATRTWLPVDEKGKHVRRMEHSATLLSDARVMIAGGHDGGAHAVHFDSAEVYDPSDGSWELTGLPNWPRSHHTAVSLPDGRVLLAGGADDGTAELYDPGWRDGDGAFRPTPLMATADIFERPAVLISGALDDFTEDASACGVLCGRVLAVGGSGAELYTPPPTILDVAEPRAPAGSRVTLTGTGFIHGVSEVSFGPQTVHCPSSSCEIVSYSDLRVDVPPIGDEATVDVTVVNEGGAATLADGFTYVGPPAQVDDLTAQAVSASEVELSWSAVGQVAHAHPPAERYVMKLSREPIDGETDFDAAMSLCGGVCEYTPGQVGDVLDLKVGVQPATDYHFAVKALDGDGTAGAMSNVVHVTTPAGSGDSDSGGTDQPDVAPGRVADLSAVGRSSSEVELVWSAAGSDGDGGSPAGEYVVKQSVEPIGSEAGFESAFTLCGDVCRFAPTTVGEQINLSVTGLADGTRYFYAVKAVDSAGNVGERSDTASAATLAADGVRRVFGAGRIQTAVELSRESFPGGASHAVVARADDFPDALAASVLAAEVDGPVLLSESGRLSDDTAAELRRLGTQTVYLAGGVQALSEQVAADLRAMDVEVVRLAGTDRIGTAAAVAREVVRLDGKTDTAIIARADGFADALAAGPLAAYTRAPVLLTHTDDLPDETLDILDEVLDGGRVTIAGGTAAVGQQPQRELEQAGYTVTRRAGPDRYATAVELADAAVTAGASRATVFAASGRNYPDALAAAPAAWKTGRLLLLIDPNDLDNSGATRDWFTRHADHIDQILIAGGPAAVSERVEDQLASVVSGS